METRVASQADLTSECWSAQLWGPKACLQCEYEGTTECGGSTIRETGKNAKGIRVPIGSGDELP
jgi:hypothetical protein